MRALYRFLTQTKAREASFSLIFSVFWLKIEILVIHLSSGQNGAKGDGEGGGEHIAPAGWMINSSSSSPRSSLLDLNVMSTLIAV